MFEYLNEEHYSAGGGLGVRVEHCYNLGARRGGGGPTTQTSRSQVLVQPYPNLRLGLG